MSSGDIVQQLSWTDDPLALWAMHAELTRRQLPPCQRWPANLGSRQAEYVTWLADIAWLVKRYPDHRPAFRGWRGAFDHPLGSDAWHATAFRQFLFISPRYGLAHWCSKGLALEDRHRADLMMLPTKSMVADRRCLSPAAESELRLAIENDAATRPDRSGRWTAAALADRRARLWRVFVLAGCSATEAVRSWALLTGETMSRQALSRQIEAVERAHKRQRSGR